MSIETEIKFRVKDAAELARRLREAGFREETPRTFESNVLFDTLDRAMRSRTEILRIRSYGGRWVITHKRLPDGRPGEDVHKHRIETETQVGDGDVLAQVFKSIGLVEAFLRGYGGVRPLGAEERNALKVEGAVGCLRFATTRITDFSLRAPPGQPPVRDYQRFLARFAAIEGGVLDPSFERVR